MRNAEPGLAGWVREDYDRPISLRKRRGRGGELARSERYVIPRGRG